MADLDERRRFAHAAQTLTDSSTDEIEITMSLAEIEAQLVNMTPDELRRLALRSWTVFVEKEAVTGAASECGEDDPQLLAALDEAIEKADAAPLRGYSGKEVRSRLGKWTSR